MANIKVGQALTDTDTQAVYGLFQEYLSVLKTDFNQEIGCAAGQADMADFPSSFAALFLARLDGASVAACGVKRINERDCELVRLYCRAHGRGHGLGRALSLAALDYARAQSYKRLVLSTEPAMRHAIRLYQSMGFRDIANYAPSACSKYMGLVL